MANGPRETGSDSDRLRSPFRLGPWVVEPDLNRIVAGDEQVSLIPRNMKVLCVLAGQAGRVVLREELLQIVWPDVIVNEEVLTSAVSELRSALGDEPRHPRYIQTIRKKGYRLLVPAVPVAASELATAELAAVGNPTATTAVGSAGRSRIVSGFRDLRWQAMLLLALVAVLALALWITGRGSRSTDLWECRPLTTAVGDESCPSLSPDGRWVAFARRHGNDRDGQLVVRRCDDDSELQLTSGPGLVTYSAWSPDGGRLAFCRARGDSSELCLIPALGGQVTRVADIYGPVRGLDWSPDGRLLACARFDARFVVSVQLLSLEDRRWSILTEPLVGSNGEGWPAFSPDGQRIAFTRADSNGWDDVFVVALTGGAPRRLSRHPLQIVGLDWLPDGRHLAVAGGESGNAQLWRLDAANGELRRGPSGPELIIRPSVASRAPGLAAENLVLERDLYRLTLDSAPGAVRDTTPVALIVLNSTRSDEGVVCSPSGTRLAFVSRRSGDQQVYVARLDGTRPLPVTSLERAQIWGLHWSEDERRLLFSARREAQLGFYAVDLETRRLDELLPANPALSSPRLSRNGQWVYANVVTDGRWEFNRLRLADGRRERILDSAARCLFDSPNADTVWCAPLLGARVYRWIANGDKSVWEDVPPTANRILRAATTRHIYGLNGSADRGALWRRDLESGAVDTLLHLDGRRCESLSVDRDGRWLYLSLETRRDHDLVLVPDYH